MALGAHGDSTHVTPPPFHTQTDNMEVPQRFHLSLPMAQKWAE